MVKKKIWVSVIIAVILVIAFFAIRSISNLNKIIVEDDEFRCIDYMECPSCNVTITCMDLRDVNKTEYLLFRVRNQRNIPGECTAEIMINDSIKRYKLGKFEAGESRTFKLKESGPVGDFRFGVKPICTWS
jgi:hypothetical protein